jgi:hypothetical protein
VNTRPQERRQGRAWTGALLAGAGLLLALGCGGPPQAAPANQRLISSLRTALSVQKLDWLEQNVQEIESRRAAGQMSDVEHQAFQAIIAKAKAGQWKEAEVDAVEFQKAQRPTAEQIERLPKPQNP